MKTSAALRAKGERLAGPMPALLVRASRLAATFVQGAHGRRRSGAGDEFWQYRNAMPGDAARTIDWRRSAKSDGHFVRQKEWQAAQTVWIWVDTAQSMHFSGSKAGERKVDRARLLAMAAAILLIRAGERVGVLGRTQLKPGTGETQLARIASFLERGDGHEDYGVPDLSLITGHAQILLVSDFLGEAAAIGRAVAEVTGRGAQGVMFQVLDPSEVAFPFKGRTVFHSIGGGVEHETLKASEIRTSYIARLNERRALLDDIARKNGWRFHGSDTGHSAQAELMWIFKALEASV